MSRDTRCARIPRYLFEAVSFSPCRDDLGLFGALVDLFLWFEDTHKRRLRLSDRLLRKRWGHGSTWCVRALDLLSERAGAEHVRTSPRKSYWKIPRPTTDYFVLPFAVGQRFVLQHDIDPRMRLHQLGGLGLLYENAKQQQRVGSAEVEARVDDPWGVLGEARGSREVGEALVAQLVDRGSARWDRQVLLLQAYEELPGASEAL